MKTERKIITHTLINLVAYIVAYTLTASILLLAVAPDSNLFDVIPMLFTSFPMLFTGNLLPSLIGYGVIYLCKKVIKNELLIATKAHFFTLLAIIAIEAIGTIVYYINIGSFIGASFAILAFLIIDAVRTNKRYKKLKNPPEVIEDVENNDDNINNIDDETM